MLLMTVSQRDLCIYPLTEAWNAQGFGNEARALLNSGHLGKSQQMSLSMARLSSHHLAQHQVSCTNCWILINPSTSLAGSTSLENLWVDLCQ